MNIEAILKTVEFEFSMEEEWENVYTSFDFPEDAQYVIEDIASGNPFAWFCAKVTASVQLGDRQFSASDYLGCCSYKSEKDFMDSGYYEDMELQALNQLTTELTELHNTFK